MLPLQYKYKDIMCCVELIKEDIAQIYVNTSASNNREDTGISIDNVLDDISSTKIMNNLIYSVDKLYNNLHDCFMSITENEYNIFAEQIGFIKEIVSNICSIYKGNKYYTSYKKEIDQLESSLESLKEIDDDIRMFRINLPKDKEYRDLVSALNSL